MRLRDIVGFVLFVALVWIVVSAITPTARASKHQTTVPPMRQGLPAYSDDTTVTVRPSISARFINTVWCTYHSPVCGMRYAQALYDDGVQFGIDPAYPLAFFLNESSFGTRGEAVQSHSLGNMRCVPGYRCVDDYAQFDTWEDGFLAWYRLIRTLYIDTWHLTTVPQIIHTYAPNADHNNEAHYATVVEQAVDLWRAGKVALP